MQDYEKRFHQWAQWVRNHPLVYMLIRWIYEYTPYLVACGYFTILFVLLRTHLYRKLIQCMIVPALTFGSVSLFRKLIDAKRPYTKYAITPLITKDKSGESFPSRHTVSVAIIAMTCTYIYPPIGIILWILTVLIAVVRVMAGVHFVKDVVAGIVYGVVFGIVGFWVL